MRSDAELDELAANIKRFGLEKPLTLDRDGKLLVDGRNRREACRRAGLESFQVPAHCLKDREDPVEYVLTMNMQHQRHLDESERAWIASGIESLTHGGDRSKMPGGSLTRDAIAKMANVGVRSIARAAKVRQAGAPELIALLRQRAIKVSEAERLAKFSHAEQSEMIGLEKADHSTISVQTGRSPD